MAQTENLEKKKVVVLAGTVAIFTMLLNTLPAVAVRHHMPAMYVVIPLIFGVCFAMVYLLAALTRMRAKPDGGQHGSK